MFEFDIEKYKPVRTLNAQGIPAFICHKRKKYILPTPEETVRQAFLKFIITEKGFPQELIEVEKPLAHFEKGVPGRADVVIYNHIDNKPLLLVECKEGTQELTDETLQQLVSYNNTIDALYPVFVIGSKIYFFDYLFNESNEIERMVLRTEMPTYQQLLDNEDFSYTDPVIEYKRPLIAGPYQRIARFVLGCHRGRYG